MREHIVVSPLGKTWILDLDGTLLKHNGYKLDGMDTVLPGAVKFMQQIAPKDLVVIITSRPKELAKQTENFLSALGWRWDTIVYGAPYGERILLNDCKPSGLKTAIAINLQRDEFEPPDFVTDEEL